MMTVPNYSAYPTLCVDIALATTKVDCQVTAISVWLRTPSEVLDPVSFISSNSLQSEIFAKAGIADSTYFNLITLQNSTEDGPYYVYELRLSHTDA